MIRTAALVAALVLAAPAAAAGPISTSERFPVAGKATTITTPPMADRIEVTYSPSSEVVDKQILEIKKLTPTEAGKPYQTVWIPRRAGVVKLADGWSETRVSVRFEGVPPSGIFIMILAAVILFGGAFLSLRSILSRDG